jgi:hypothetical protein
VLSPFKKSYFVAVRFNEKGKIRKIIKDSEEIKE